MGRGGVRAHKDGTAGHDLPHDDPERVHVAGRVERLRVEEFRGDVERRADAGAGGVRLPGEQLPRESKVRDLDDGVAALQRVRQCRHVLRRSLHLRWNLHSRGRQTGGGSRQPRCDEAPRCRHGVLRPWLPNVQRNFSTLGGGRYKTWSSRAGGMHACMRDRATLLCSQQQVERVVGRGAG